MKASVESLEAQVEELEEENAMLKMDLEELTASSTDADFRLRQELRDAQEELERLRQQQQQQQQQQNSGAGRGRMAITSAESGAGVDVDAVLQRVQQLQKHLATCRNSVQAILEAPGQSQ